MVKVVQRSPIWRIRKTKKAFGFLFLTLDPSGVCLLGTPRFLGAAFLGPPFLELPFWEPPFWEHPFWEPPLFWEQAHFSSKQITKSGEHPQ
jgi:hypothetical protein